VQVGLAYVAWTMVFHLLTGPAIQSKSQEKAKVPDQAKLQGYLERCEKALGPSWLISTNYNIIARKSSIDSEEKGVGRVILLRVPGMPEIFWHAEEMTGKKESIFRLHIGQCRFSCHHEAKKYHGAALDLRNVRLSSFEWNYDEKFWVSNAPRLWINGSIGSYDYFFENGEFLFGKHLSLGFFDEFFEKLIVAIQSRGPVGLLISMKSGQTQKRFEIKMTKDDKSYIYIEGFPKDHDDKMCFSKSQVVIDKSTYLPRRLWYVDSSRDATTYTFTKILRIP
jgi:hypothetical protein